MTIDLEEVYHTDALRKMRSVYHSLSEKDGRRHAAAEAILSDASEYVAPGDEAAYVSEFWQHTLPGFRPNNSSDDGMRIQQIAFSPNGKLAAIYQEYRFGSRPPYASTLGGVSILELANGETVRFLASPDQKWLRSTAFSPDGKLLAATVDHQTIFLWDVETGNEVLRIGQPPPAITIVSFSQSKPVIAAGAADGTVFACKVDSPAVLGIDRPFQSPIAHVEFANEAETLVVASCDGRVRLCSLPTLEPLVEFRPHKSRLLGGMISSDGQRFVSVVWPEFSFASLAAASLRNSS